MSNEADHSESVPSSSLETAGLCVGSKFWQDGTPRHFPGNTVISPLRIDSAEADILRDILAMVREAIAGNFVALPESSWHMTVFELLCDQVRDPGHWSAKLRTDATIAETDALFAERVPAVERPKDIRMIVRDLAATNGGLTVVLDTVDESIEKGLRSYRDALSEVTGVRFPDHDDYEFHISLAYTLLRPVGKEKERLDRTLDATNALFAGTPLQLPAPVLTYFEDMTLFSPGRRRA